MGKMRKLGPFDVRCPKCKAVHRRTTWSIAHMDVDQTFTCPACGKKIELKKAPMRRDGI